MALPVPYHPYSSKSCVYCGDNDDGGENPAALRRCSACRAVVYCGKACQRKDWNVHRRECILLQVNCDDELKTAPRTGVRCVCSCMCAFFTQDENALAKAEAAGNGRNDVHICDGNSLRSHLMLSTGSPLAPLKFSLGELNASLRRSVQHWGLDANGQQRRRALSAANMARGR